MSETAASPTDSLTVLVATDADHVHDEVDAALEGDHTVVRVHTGAEVLAAVAAHEPALVVLDLMLPGSEAIGSMIAIRAANPDLPVLAALAEPRTQ